ncbi:hypothetical protein [Crocosphaera chwakensis]|nr:hypothetical protein [Crocosphaera chwakensis]
MVGKQQKGSNYITGAVCLMDYLEKVLEKLRELAQKLIETLLGPQAEPEPELIPIPVNDPKRRHHR